MGYFSRYHGIIGTNVGAQPKGIYDLKQAIFVKGTLFDILDSSTGASTYTGEWQEFSIIGDGTNKLIVWGAGGGSGSRASYQQSGGAGATLEITLNAEIYNLRVWVGKGGTQGVTSTNTDLSGYGANGGAGGVASSTPGHGGQGGTPTIVERYVDGGWELFAMAGAGGGGGQHTNTSTARGGGGGNWFSHSSTNQTTINGTLAGGYGGTTQALPDLGGTNFYNAGASSQSASNLGGAASTLNQYAGGGGGASTGNTAGGGGGGGYGGGGGGAGGGAGGSPGAGGYFMIGTTRYGGTGGGGYHTSSCGGGGGGGGCYLPADHTTSEYVGGAVGWTTTPSTGTSRPAPGLSPSAYVSYGIDATTGYGSTVENGFDGGWVFYA